MQGRDGKATQRTDQRAVVAELARRHAAEAWRLARRLAGEDAAAEDAVQEAFLGLLRARTIREADAEALRPYLLKAVARAALRRRKARGSFASLDELPEPAAPDGVPARLAEQRELLAALEAELAALPEESREPLVLQYWGGLSQAEVGAALGLSRQAVTQRSAEARETLRRRLSRRGFAVAGAALLGLLEASGKTAAAAAAPTGLAAELAAMVQTAPLAAAGSAAKAGALFTIGGIAVTKTMLAVTTGTLAAVLAVGAAVQLSDGGEGGRKKPKPKPKPKPTATVVAATKPPAATPTPAATGVAWGAAVNGLQLGLSAEQAQFLAGHPLVLTVHLKNVGTTPLKFGRRPGVILSLGLTADLPGMPLDQATKRFVLAAGEEHAERITVGPKIPIWPPEGSGAAGPTGYRELAPGRYPVTISWKDNWSRGYYKDPALWDGEVQSGAVEIEVVLDVIVPFVSPPPATKPAATATAADWAARADAIVEGTVQKSPLSEGPGWVWVKLGNPPRILKGEDVLAESGGTPEGPARRMLPTLIRVRAEPEVGALAEGAHGLFYLKGNNRLLHFQPTAAAPAASPAAPPAASPAAPALSQSLELRYGRIVSSANDEKILDRLRRQLLTPAALKSGRPAGEIIAYRIRFPARWHVDPLNQATYRLSTNDPAKKLPSEGTGYAQMDIWIQDKASPEEARRSLETGEGQTAAARRFEIAGRPAVQYRFERERPSPGFPGVTPAPSGIQDRFAITKIIDGRTWIFLEGRLAADAPATCLDELEAIGRSFEFPAAAPAATPAPVLDPALAAQATLVVTGRVRELARGGPPRMMLTAEQALQGRLPAALTGAPAGAYEALEHDLEVYAPAEQLGKLGVGQDGVFYLKLRERYRASYDLLHFAPAVVAPAATPKPATPKPVPPATGEAAFLTWPKLSGPLVQLLERRRAGEPYDNLKQVWLIEDRPGGETATLRLDLVQPDAAAWDRIARAAKQAGGQEQSRLPQYGMTGVQVPVARLEEFLRALASLGKTVGHISLEARTVTDGPPRKMGDHPGP